MTLAKRNNRNALSPVDVFDRLFDDVFESPFGLFGRSPLMARRTNLLNDFSYASTRQPIRQIKGENGNMTYEFDVPGLDKEDIELTYEENVLSVSSVQKTEEEGKTHSQAINYRIWAPDLDVEAMEATCDKGILTVRASPIKEVITKQKIEIK
jgi:HSP20 family protein